jgi:hypothetical protein
LSACWFIGRRAYCFLIVIPAQAGIQWPRARFSRRLTIITGYRDNSAHSLLDSGLRQNDEQRENTRVLPVLGRGTRA